MATTIARLQAILSADTKAFDRAMDKSHKGMSGVGKAAGIAGAAIAGGLALGLRAGVKEFMAAEKVGAQTNAVIKSTGGTANVSAKQVDKLATSLMKKSGVDDEAIKSGQNMLLTFKAIRNETGRGRDIFDQATKATLDLSVAMGKDMQSSAILVGKALQDPIRGMTALRRVGVSLSADQEQLVKDLIKGKSAIDNLNTSTLDLTAGQQEQAIKMSKLGMGWEEIANTLNIKVTPAQKASLDFWEQGGHTMKAQQMILKELNSEFGGSAEAVGKTLPGQLNILKETMNNLAADIVKGLIPAG